jgi:cell fate (sporulation/competence/biofilm development) regulator YlbF (YheA/YmcA/DUF963 family)
MPKQIRWLRLEGEYAVDDILQLAGRLGKAISGSPQAAKLRTARKALEEEKDIEQTLSDYQAQVDKIAKLQEENKPIEVEDKRKLQQLQDKLLSAEVFKNFTAAQVEYVDLMRRVNEALRTQLAETESS